MIELILKSFGEVLIASFFTALVILIIILVTKEELTSSFAWSIIGLLMGLFLVFVHGLSIYFRIKGW